MYARIVIAVDGSDIGERALEHGLRLAKAVGSPVTIVHVTESTAVMGAGYATVAGTIVDPVPELVAAMVEAGRGILRDAEAKARALGVEAECVHVRDTYPADGIVHTADEVGAELIVMGSHGRRGLTRLLLGSQANHVLTHAKVPVLVTR